MLETNIISLSHNIFYPDREKFYLYILLSNHLSSDKSEVLMYGKDVIAAISFM